ncbi:transcriptional regulator, TetR family [Sanguibacter gelidistatuariae]|uniref:Transcriptional regulator, TetR family n=1 Tax=Sanguibacter gelidistatuariae TaxID=1814289 RepID=A0A1G6KST3_9MICO|nr:TetR/AcrR family transcriptional regulator [Sanguibacter gelidistatuariae]SDC34159.1 transcriptional regulator, TetR family [Sanguibacter gelidistatuariae]
MIQPDQPNAPRTARERARAEVMAELLAAANARLDTDGAAALSLRAIARDLGMASSAVYRYVDSRDALLTLLIVDGYNAAGLACEGAATAARGRGDGPAQVWLAVARALRAWALAHPRSYELIYGTPVPGYRAPTDTVAAATRLWAVIIAVTRDAEAAGTLAPTGPEFPTTGLITAETFAFAGYDPASGSPEQTRQIELMIVRSFTLFSCVLGAISAELFGHFHNVTADLAGVFDATIATAAAGVGLIVDVG